MRKSRCVAATVVFTDYNRIESRFGRCVVGRDEHVVVVSEPSGVVTEFMRRDVWKLELNVDEEEVET